MKKVEDLKKVYMIGIKGVAMTALAEILKAKGVQVLGSDTGETFYTDEILKSLKVTFFENFNPRNIPLDVDLVLYSTAYNKDNPEFEYALKKGLKMVSYPEFLGRLFNQAKGIAVCGTHGKTTTAAMLAYLLKEGGKDPSALIGSKFVNWGKSACSGSGDLFVVEADEYQNKLRYLNPFMVVLTNIDFDHPDFFKDQGEYNKIFFDFIKKIPKNGYFVYNIKDKNALKIAKQVDCKKISFGFDKKADFELLRRNLGEGYQEIVFKSVGKGRKMRCKIFQNGLHNALNAIAAIAAANCLGVSLGICIEKISGFLSTERRFQYQGKFNGSSLYDDYAHHPEEIVSTIKGAREFFPAKKIVVAFHPHTYTRTKKFLKEFAKALVLADLVYLIDIYASAREKAGKIKVHSRDLEKLINDFGGKAEYVKDLYSLAPKLKETLNENTVFISMGAGDIWRVHNLIKK
ncbi:MAG: UDP-N-acetylmuramate--L-alanine ligase [Candidatus Moranbacteria bacterium]|nr:UDP-N-acetylmuramate--L-alanine ligase [Candidatus Moranbacteria bacterium]